MQQEADILNGQRPSQGSDIDDWHVLYSIPTTVSEMIGRNNPTPSYTRASTFLNFEYEAVYIRGGMIAMKNHRLHIDEGFPGSWREIGESPFLGMKQGALTQRSQGDNFVPRELHLRLPCLLLISFPKDSLGHYVR